MARRSKTTPPPEDDSTPVTLARGGAGAGKATDARVQMKKKEFLDRALARAGNRKSGTRAAIDATLATLAEVLATGHDLVLPPLGKLRVVREKAGPKGRVLVVRLMLDEGGKAVPDPLADQDD